MRPRRPTLTYANVMSTFAVFGVLAGGGAYAASKIGPKDIAKNAVRAKHIKKGQVKAKHVARGAVTEAKLADGVEGLQGPRGQRIAPQPSPLRLALRARLRDDGCGPSTSRRNTDGLDTGPHAVEITRCWHASQLLLPTRPTRRYTE